MILLIGPLADTGTAHLALLLMDRDIDFVLLDPRNFGDAWEIAWRLDGKTMKGHVRCDERRINLDDVTAVWAHMLMLPEHYAESGAPRNDQLATLVAFADSFPRRVINRPSAASSNSVKPYQAQIIKRCGFDAIDTLVTNIEEEARAFIEKHGSQVIFKSISWRRSIVRRVTEEDLARLAGVENCPTQFQEYVPGTDIRVHVVGDRVFATEITCHTDDYRYVPTDQTRTMREVSLPDEIEERCIALCRELKFEVGGVDLRRRPDGGYVCFEVNPVPGYMFYEGYTGQRIGEAFADLLCSGEHVLQKGAL